MKAGTKSPLVNLKKLFPIHFLLLFSCAANAASIAASALPKPNSIAATNPLITVVAPGNATHGVQQISAEELLNDFQVGGAARGFGHYRDPNTGSNVLQNSKIDNNAGKGTNLFTTNGVLSGAIVTTNGATFSYTNVPTAEQLWTVGPGGGQTTPRSNDFARIRNLEKPDLSFLWDDFERYVPPGTTDLGYTPSG